jgi:hypothetical protein
MIVVLTRAWMDGTLLGGDTGDAWALDGVGKAVDDISSDPSLTAALVLEFTGVLKLFVEAIDQPAVVADFGLSGMQLLERFLSRP